MTAMTERDAKAAVREYLDMLGKPIGSDHAYTKFYDDTHAWANSPDGPNAEPIAAGTYGCVKGSYAEESVMETNRQLRFAVDTGKAELAEFKARVKAAIECVFLLISDQVLVQVRRYLTPILSECEPPAPRQPKFAVPGWYEVVGRARRAMYFVEVKRGREFEYRAERSDVSEWWRESDILAPLTPEEKG